MGSDTHGGDNLDARIPHIAICGMFHNFLLHPTYSTSESSSATAARGCTGGGSLTGTLIHEQ